LWIINFFRFVRLVFICANPHHLRHLRAFETPPYENQVLSELLKWMGRKRETKHRWNSLLTNSTSKKELTVKGAGKRRKKRESELPTEQTTNGQRLKKRRRRKIKNFQNR
ncbi:MAG: hypothetical protein LBF89_09880, partial [Bacteroidales bacterium]|nr:hypothetical protein [Bacteroidales bacterium]